MWSMNQSSTTPNSKKRLGFGLTAGLIGGTAAGLVFGVPGISGAANDNTAPAALVQQTDEPDVSVVDEQPDFEPGTKLRESLQELVDNETITAAQADAVTEHLVAHLAANRPERGEFGMGDRGMARHGGPGKFGRLGGEFSTAVTDLLRIDAETLRTDLPNGASLADIATAHGVETQALIDVLVGEAEAKVAEAVDAGKVDADKAAEFSADLEERITDMVNRVRGDFERPGPPPPAEESAD